MIWMITYRGDIMVNDNKKEIRALVIFILVLFLIYFTINSNAIKYIMLLFIDDNGKLIKGNIVTIIGSLITLLSLITTIAYTERNRKKQNRYDVEKEIILKRQYDFDQAAYKVSELMDATEMLKSFSSVSTMDNIKILSELSRYILQIKNANKYLFFYYDFKVTNNNFSELMKYNKIYME